MLGFLSSYFGVAWPVAGAALVLALAGHTAERRWGAGGLVMVAAALCTCLVPVEWWRTQSFLKANPSWSIPASELWNDVLWDSIALLLVAVAIYGLTKLRWRPGIQTAVAVLVALLLPPAVAVAGLVIGCAGFGQCP